MIFKKIITAGDGGVGKTTLLHRFIEGKFLVDTRMTIGVEFFLKDLTFDGVSYKLQLWDLGGQDEFRDMVSRYILGANGALLMIDLTRMVTIKGIDGWVKILRQEDPNLPILLIGTKLDLHNKISVDDVYALELKEKYNFIEYIKTSSKNGENINESFVILIRKMKEQEPF